MIKGNTFRKAAAITTLCVGTFALVVPFSSSPPVNFVQQDTVSRAVVALVDCLDDTYTEANLGQTSGVSRIVRDS